MFGSRLITKGTYLRNCLVFLNLLINFSNAAEWSIVLEDRLKNHLHVFTYTIFGGENNGQHFAVVLF